MCVLRVAGKTFDAERYLAASGLTAVNLFHAGEPRAKTQPEGTRRNMSGFTVDVSRAPWTGLQGQVADAIAFLTEHEQALTMLHAADGVDTVCLDFPINLRIDYEHVAAQFDYFPAELVQKAGALGLGLELSIYPRDLEARAKARSEAKQKLNE